MIQLRYYSPSDFETLHSLLKLNIPAYFAPEELFDFEKYLNSDIEDYFVATTKGEIVGCGGINYNHAQKSTFISWDIIHPDWQGKGVGSQLLQHRLNLIKKQFPHYQIIVRTSQLVYPFYEKHGFKLLEKHPNYWAEGYDMYYMKYLIGQ